MGLSGSTDGPTISSDRRIKPETVRQTGTQLWAGSAPAPDPGTGTDPEPADRECSICPQPLSGRTDPPVPGKEALSELKPLKKNIFQN